MFYVRLNQTRNLYLSNKVQLYLSLLFVQNLEEEILENDEEQPEEVAAEEREENTDAVKEGDTEVEEQNVESTSNDQQEPLALPPPVEVCICVSIIKLLFIL